MNTPLDDLDDLYCVYFDNDAIKEKHGITEETTKEKYENIRKALTELEQLKDIEEEFGISPSDLRKNLMILRILKKHREQRYSLNYVTYINKYWKKENIKITKHLLKAHDLPFSVYEFKLIAEWLEVN